MILNVQISTEQNQLIYNFSTFHCLEIAYKRTFHLMRFQFTDKLLVDFNNWFLCFSVCLQHKFCCNWTFCWGSCIFDCHLIKLEVKATPNGDCVTSCFIIWSTMLTSNKPSSTVVPHNVMLLSMSC